MTKEQEKKWWDVVGRIGGSISLLLLSVIAYFLIDLHGRFNQYAEAVTTLRIEQADIKKDVAYHAVYINQYAERLKALEAK